jgi:polysaccharide deacetylase family protein (PEP-CTERM system associated)
MISKPRKIKKLMRNALTIDLEDYYHVSAFRNQIPASQWTDQLSRVEQNTDRLLDWFDEAGFKATFFTLGWVAERHAHVVRRVVERGHEIACHSMRHRMVYEMTPGEFREDTRQAKDLLEQVSGCVVQGYRAPSFSITQQSLWALEILAELGFVYDSSIFPVRHPNYGMIKASRFPFRIRTPAGTIVEFPMTTLEVAGKRSPLGGGAYLRILPYVYTRWGISYINDREARPVCVYMHPWEIDPDQPRMQGSLTARLRHYLGLDGAASKLRKLLHDFEFCPLNVVVEDWRLREDSPNSTELNHIVLSGLSQ